MITLHTDTCKIITTRWLRKILFLDCLLKTRLTLPYIKASTLLIPLTAFTKPTHMAYSSLTALFANLFLFSKEFPTSLILYWESKLGSNIHFVKVAKNSLSIPFHPILGILMDNSLLIHLLFFPALNILLTDLSPFPPYLNNLYLLVCQLHQPHQLCLHDHLLNLLF